jgi:hypothetical protein
MLMDVCASSVAGVQFSPSSEGANAVCGPAGDRLNRYGVAPPTVGHTEPSQTHRFQMSQLRQSASTTLVHQSFPGRTSASNSFALCFNTLPSSGSEGIMLTKFLASFSVICGGSGGTFGSV